MQYRTVWVSQWVSASDKIVACTEVDAEVRRWTDDGWQLHTVVPGTNAQTYGGLFLTFSRP
jgi:hypothetical protein